MSQPVDNASAGSARTHKPRDRASRVFRLAVKELRETLRDRRTIATLILMPLLVYPVLSLAFRQFLLTSMQPGSNVPWLVVTRSQEQQLMLALLVKRGDQLLRGGSQGVVRPGVLSVEEAAEPPLDQLHIEVDSQYDLAERVRRGDVDVAVRVQPRGPPTAAGPPAFADFELIYRPSAPISRQVARFLERRLQAVNDEYTHQRLKQLGDKGELPAAWKLMPLPSQKGQEFGLATIVPLILILMTITGAVYPAIDLTAGERERGTLESLMAAPIPRLSLLFAKYIAVVVVAMLTAVVNMVGMTITVYSTGLGPVLFGDRGLSLSSVAIVFGLLLLFAAFFSALLLCVTSFARSFKEAQAYLIPLMLISLAPGLVSVMPNLHLNPVMSVAPLANIVLLARDVLEGDAHPLWGLVAIVSTALYGTAALGVAARVFGGDSVLYASQGSWKDLLRRPEQPVEQTKLSDALAVLAIIVPLFVILSGFLAQLDWVPMWIKLSGSAGITLLLFLAVPLAAARWELVLPHFAFQLRGASPLAFVGAIVLGLVLWPLAYELVIASRELGLTTISDQQLQEHAGTVDRLVAEWRRLSPIIVLAAVAIVPAVCEEFFFRGYLLGAMRGRVKGWLAILFVAVIFGLFHASVGGLIAVERVLSSMAMGVVLGYICWMTRSVFPGIVLHALNNSVVVSLAYWGEGLKSLGIDAEGRQHLPLPWLACAVLLMVVGLGLVYLGRAPSPLPLREKGQG